MIKHLRDFPLLVFVVSLAALWFSARIGVILRKRFRPVEEEERQDLATVEAATLTLLGLIIAFSFSMAIGRYDQRKNYEAEEANAIGTEYVRADLLQATEAEKVHKLLKEYLRQRVAFYETRNERELQQIGTITDELEAELWSNIRSAAVSQPTPPVALAGAGMND